MSRRGSSHGEQNALTFAEGVVGEHKSSADQQKKKKKRQRGSEIVFNPQEHK
jgi:hypothetical protein